MGRLKSMFSPLKCAADAVLEINPEGVCEGRSLPRAAAPKGQPPIAGGETPGCAQSPKAMGARPFQGRKPAHRTHPCRVSA